MVCSCNLVAFFWEFSFGKYYLLFIVEIIDGSSILLRNNFFPCFSTNLHGTISQSVSQ